MASTKGFIGSEGFVSQKGIKESTVDFSTDNLFTGVWNLNENNIERFDPFIGGQAAIYWTRLPQFFTTDATKNFRSLTTRNFKSFSGIGDITLDTDQISHGFTGNELPVATTIKKENTSFTLKHYELAGSPIRELYQYWVTGIRDPETGIATYHGQLKEGGLTYSMKNHTGELIYVVTDPSFALGGASGIEFAAYYTNVFPTKIPQDHLNYSSGDHGLVEVDIEFRGCFHQSSDINSLAAQIMKSSAYNKTYGDYKVTSSNGGTSGGNDVSADSAVAGQSGWYGNL